MSYITKIVGMFTGIGPAITGASLLVKVLLVVGVFAGGALAYGAWRTSLVNEGREAAIADIARGDKEIIEKARQGRSRVNQCRAIGREWDQTTGECVR